MRTATAEKSVTHSLGEIGLLKTPTGIKGLDEVTGGGLPAGRPTLVCGPAGCGKTLLSMEFLVRGAVEQGDPGVFLAFEESRLDLIANVASLGFDLEQLEADGLLVVDSVVIEANDFVVSGEWDLEGLFIRLGAAIDAVGAKRVVIDTIENLFSAVPDWVTLRSELRRLFRWLKERGVTSIVTGERGNGKLTRHGFEEYVSDCVIVLDHRVVDECSTRRLRVLKYRGSLHGTNEYPFLITQDGLSVMPITSLVLDHPVFDERVSLGVAGLDEMLGGEGIYRGSSLLLTGTAGTGKSTLAARMCDAACRRGERALYFAYEESEAQIVRNMASVGLDLGRWVRDGLLRFACARPSLFGLEAHLIVVQEEVMAFAPTIVVMDPVSALFASSVRRDVSGLLIRQVDFLKTKGVTAMFTSLEQSWETDHSHYPLTTLMDVWVQLQSHQLADQRNTSVTVLKARGTANSHQVREMVITDRGVEVADAPKVPGPNGATRPPRASR